MEHRTVWNCLVEKDRICAFDDKAGVEFFKNFPFLIDLARKMLDSDYYELSFYYQENGVLFIQFYFNKNHNIIEVSAIKTDVDFNLTPRELDTITLLSSGLSDQQIANHLFSSHRTVNKHIQHIFEKTGVNNRVHLTRLANECGLYRLPSTKTINSDIPILKLEHSLYQNINPSNINKKSLRPKNKSPLKIGLPYVGEGYGQLDAISMVNGAKLAVNIINQQGGIHGRNIELIPQAFTAFDKHSILTAYHTLLDQDIDGISAGYACYLPEVHELMATKGLPYLHTATNDKAMRYASQ